RPRLVGEQPRRLHARIELAVDTLDPGIVGMFLDAGMNPGPGLVARIVACGDQRALRTADEDIQQRGLLQERRDGLVGAAAIRLVLKHFVPMDADIRVGDAAAAGLALPEPVPVVFSPDALAA